MPVRERDIRDIVAKASTIEERINSPILRPKPVDGASAIAQDRLERWIENSAQGNRQRFLERLQLDGISKADISENVKQALAPNELTHQAKLPAWAHYLEAYIDQVMATPPSKGWEFIDRQNPQPFEEVIAPLVGLGFKVLEKRMKHTSILTHESSITLQQWLLRWCCNIACQVFWYEFSLFQYDRLGMGERSSSTRESEESDAMYREFISCLSHGDVLMIFKKYSALARALMTRVELWQECVSKILERLDADWEDIRSTFGNSEGLGSLVGVRPLSVDVHRGGQATVELTFSSETKVVYKPRNVGLERSFYELVDWLSERADLNMKTPHVIERDHYGWVEFIEFQSCPNQESAHRYFQRAGALLAIAYAVSAIDCNVENIIAHGEYPVLIDVEMASYPPMHRSTGKVPDDATQAYPSGTVTDTLLLPSSGTEHKSGFLGGLKSHDSKRQVKVWHNVNTDAMSLAWVETDSLPDINLNQPKLQESTLAIYEFRDDFKVGFTKMYYCILKYRENMLSQKHPWENLKCQRIRFLIRPTRVYDAIVKASLRPKHCQTGVDRSIELERLLQPVVLHQDNRYLWPLVKAEQRALQLMDIPLFETTTNDRDLYSQEGDKVKNMFSESGFEHARQRLKRLSEDDLSNQLNVIDEVLAFNSGE